MQKLTKGQKEALQYMQNGYNVFLSGEGGTGKSYVIKLFLDNMSAEQRKKVLVCAPTGIASINIKGVTIHRAFNLSPNVYGKNDVPPAKANEKLIASDIIIIDEISMVRFDLFHYMTKCIRLAEKKREKRIQVITVGDFFQLPPVLTDKDRFVLKELWGGDVGNGYAFQSELWKSYKFKSVVLNEMVRAGNDVEFTKHLNMLRKGQDNENNVEWFNSATSKHKFDKAVTLCATNKQALKINSDNIEKLKSKKEIMYKAEINGIVSSSDLVTEEKITIKIGCRVMSLVNATGGEYQNGTLGTVLEINNNYVKVAFDNGNICNIDRYKWNVENYITEENGGEITLSKKIIGDYTQIPLKIAYAITMHKAQGMTYDKVNIIPMSFAVGQMYVALSRATSAKGVYLDGLLQEKSIHTASEVVDFYNSIVAEPAEPPAEPPQKKKENRGGKRENAGRRYKYKQNGENLKLKVIKIPEKYENEIRAYIEELINK